MKRKPPKPWLVRRRQCLKCGEFFRSKGNWNRLCTSCRCENNAECRGGSFEDPDLIVNLGTIRKSTKVNPYNTPVGRSEV